MTTTRTLQILGLLVYRQVDTVPDDEVTEGTKSRVHQILDNGYFDHMMYSADEQLVWELVGLLGYNRTSQIWEAEQAIFALIDQYDLFND